MSNPYKTPESQIGGDNGFTYVGFWARAGATIIDTIIMLLITTPILMTVYGENYYLSEEMINGPLDFLLSYVFPAVAVILFWVYKSATPGKMAVKAKIVNAKTGQKASTGQLIGRYFAYYISLLPLGLGILWVAWDKKKQGFHDKLAGTVVIRPADFGETKAEFN
ncbi:RDD family protein [Spartinivicinus ruber]|uniref:RDD family protein n=1 Tax=Spartinivicinus ruber TaxID=2683272 RepID=UPI001E52DFF4|nr:RDD family protein [Spartinivicinus ruber]